MYVVPFASFFKMKFLCSVHFIKLRVVFIFVVFYTLTLKLEKWFPLQGEQAHSLYLYEFMCISAYVILYSGNCNSLLDVKRINSKICCQ